MLGIEINRDGKSQEDPGGKYGCVVKPGEGGMDYLLAKTII